MGEKKKKGNNKLKKKDVSSSTEDVSSSTEGVSSSTKDVSSSTKDVSSSTKDVSSSTEGVSSSTKDPTSVKISKDKFSFININETNIDGKYRQDISELEVFSDDNKSYQEKRKVFVELLLKFILTIKKFIELLLNKTADKIEKQETFHLFLWQLKKIILIMNSQNPMKVKNNAF